MEEEAMRTTRKGARGRSLRALTTTLVLAFLAAMLLAGAALAAVHESEAKTVKPGQPTARAPEGTITIATPTFKWSKVKGATRYELRLYEGPQPLVTVTDLRGPSITMSMEMPTGVTLTWKVRASNSGGNGPWSKTLTFEVVTG
jgi:hypothetical protein